MPSHSFSGFANVCTHTHTHTHTRTRAHPQGGRFQMFPGSVRHVAPGMQREDRDFDLQQREREPENDKNERYREEGREVYKDRVRE